MSMKSDFFSRLKQNHLAVAGLIFIMFIAFLAIFASYISPYEYDAIVGNIFLPPSGKFLLGTDEIGRDCMSRMIYGARISLLVGFVSVGISTVIGISIGAISGFYGGRTEKVLMRFVDMMYCFPTFFLILTTIAFIGSSIWNIMIVIGLTSWMGVSRLVRAEFLSLKEREFVLAAQTSGAKDFRIIFRHILPNCMAPILVAATLGIAGAILTESSLSFLGIGIQPPNPSWGGMLTAGQDKIEVAWWLSVFPGLAILATVLGYNLLGEGVRDAIDPRLKS